MWAEDDGQRLVTGVVDSVDADGAMVRVAAFDDAELSTFGPCPAPDGLVVGDDVLVAFDQNGEAWIASPGGSGGTAAVAAVAADVAALSVSTDTRLDALEVGPPSWTLVPAFSGTWVNFDAARPARYYKHTGRVYLEGLIKSGTVNTAAFTLPSGFRHDRTQPLQFPVISNDAFGAVTISSGGVVTPYVGSAAYFDLSAISFRHA